MSYFGKFYLTGPDAQKAADWLFSADVARDPGSTVYTCMLNNRGGIEADLTVVSKGEIKQKEHCKGKGLQNTLFLFQRYFLIDFWILKFEIKKLVYKSLSY